MTDESPPQPSASPAGLWPRVAAAVYDLFLLGTILFIGSFLAIAVTGGEAITEGNWFYRIYLLALAALFNCWFWTHGGQTLGMRAWRLMVADADGKPISWSRAALRFFCAGPAWLSVVGLFWCEFDKEKRALHDLISGTRVVRLPKKP